MFSHIGGGRALVCSIEHLSFLASWVGWGWPSTLQPPYWLRLCIYDLELTEVSSNSELRRLLLATENRSILVVEDIDCSAQLHDRDAIEEAKALALENQQLGNVDLVQKMTLSGFLNFVDGLWSSCGDERIIIFTTNKKDKLDPALLRPGRMDVHIHMSYCTQSGFRLLVSNYFSIDKHSLFDKIEDLIRDAEITPAEVAEQLLKNDDPDIALHGLIELLVVKRTEEEEKLAAKGMEQRLDDELATKQNENNQKD